MRGVCCLQLSDTGSMRAVFRFQERARSQLGSSTAPLTARTTSRILMENSTESLSDQL